MVKEDGQVLSNVRTQWVIESARKKPNNSQHLTIQTNIKEKHPRHLIIQKKTTVLSIAKILGFTRKDIEKESFQTVWKKSWKQ